MKKLSFILFTAITFFSCSKSNTPPPTTLVVSVSGNTGWEPGANVYLYDSKADWENAIYNGANTSVASAITNANGEVTFKNLDATKVYYWLANDGCQNSVNDSLNTQTTLYVNVANTGIAQLQSTETITLKNTNSAFSVNVTVNGIFWGSLAAGATATIIPYAQVAGAYIVECYNPSDLQTQYINVAPDVCGGTLAETTNP